MHIIVIYVIALATWTVAHWIFKTFLTPSETSSESKEPSNMTQKSEESRHHVPEQAGHATLVEAPKIEAKSQLQRDVCLSAPKMFSEPSLAEQKEKPKFSSESLVIDPPIPASDIPTSTEENAPMKMIPTTDSEPANACSAMDAWHRVDDYELIPLHESKDLIRVSAENVVFATESLCGAKLPDTTAEPDDSLVVEPDVDQDSQGGSEEPISARRIEGIDARSTSTSSEEWEDDDDIAGVSSLPIRLHDPEKAQELKKKGNDAVQNQQLDEALRLYEEALTYCDREQDTVFMAILEGNCSACHFGLKNYDQAVESATRAIELDPTYVKAYLRRYRAQKMISKYHAAVTDLEEALKLSPSLKAEYAAEHAEVFRLSNEQLEKEKEEMVAKLKDAGNWLLGKVGLSLDNFKVDQNEGGSYNISFQQPNAAPS